MPGLPPQLKDWVPVAHEILKTTASTYQQTITYSELAELVQTRSGVRAAARPSAWMGPLLDVVALHAQRSGEPPLTSLAVRHDGRVGEAYAKAAVINGTSDVSDLEARAAEHRLACYRAFAADVPEDAAPALTAQEARRRATAKAAAAKAAPQRHAPVCGRCFVQLPLSGSCDTCD
ncbi:hypothetical protein [Aeromicrobium sp. IC_218]|uniref:hypothetical protein n=1 Tax=Aeromicrobium sp. IC_218 TaxID=2545468 RepID=UPI0010402AB6|nr:hypothetical protein [Aeromicrobium sp. IC_218]TCJ00202.1 hypothetical protein E0W78_03140 [Aeromicrobium sp. IC_218]